MGTVNDEMREVRFKLVFVGPAQSGKTSNLLAVHGALDPAERGELIAVNASADRTLFFDYTPANPVLIAGYQTEFLLYTVPGEVVYNATWELVLRGVDGLVFVADSDPARWQANLESWRNLEETLQNNGSDLSSVPLVLQYNKRDLSSAMPLAQLEAGLNANGNPAFEASAKSGEGVLDTLDLLSREVLSRFQEDWHEPEPAIPERLARPVSGAAAW